MTYGKWSDRFGGDDQPYEYVDLYDADSGEMFTWSVDQDLEVETRPEVNTEALVRFDLRKQSRPAMTTVKKGDRKGEVIDFVQEKLKVKVVGFGKVPAGSATPAKSQSAGQAKAA